MNNRQDVPNENHLLQILTALSDAEVEFIICGGMAAILHGVERMTLDINLSVNLDSINVNRLVPVMKSLRMPPRVPVDALILADPAVVKMMVEEKNAIVFSFIDPDQPFRHLDVFLTDQLAYNRLFPDSQIVHIGNRKFRVLTIKKLLELKEAISPQREKDQLDIKTLRRLLES